MLSSCHCLDLAKSYLNSDIFGESSFRGFLVFLYKPCCCLSSGFSRFIRLDLYFTAFTLLKLLFLGIFPCGNLLSARSLFFDFGKYQKYTFCCILALLRAKTERILSTANLFLYDEDVGMFDFEYHTHSRLNSFNNISRITAKRTRVGSL